MHKSASESKRKPEAELQLETVDVHAPGHVHTKVRREHQARTHVRTSEESTKRTVHIQQWGSHPLSLAGWQGPAKRNETSNKLNDLEKAEISLHNLCIWSALIVVTIVIAPRTTRISASSAR